MKATTWLFLIAICGFQTGCIGLSRKHAVQQWGIHAKLVDDVDLTPLSQRSVVVSIDGKESKKRTNRSGNLQTPTSTNPYWTWLGGPVMASSPTAAISISTVDYRPHSLKWQDRGSGKSGGAKVVRPSFGRPYLDLGVVKLEKREQGTGVVRQ